MTIVADAYTYVVGVDAHAATHHYAVIDTRTGGVVDDAEFPTHAKGLLRAGDWIARRTGEATGGDLARVLISIEGTRSYGAQLATLLTQTGYRVVDAPRPSGSVARARTTRSTRSRPPAAPCTRTSTSSPTPAPARPRRPCRSC